MSLKRFQFLLFLIILKAVTSSAGRIEASGSMLVASLWGNGEVVGFDMDASSLLKWRLDTGESSVSINPVDESKVVLWTRSEILAVDSRTGKVLTRIVPQGGTNMTFYAVSTLSGGDVVSLLIRNESFYTLQRHSLSSGALKWQHNLDLSNVNVMLQPCGDVISLIFSPVNWRENDAGKIVTVGGATGWMVFRGEDGAPIKTKLMSSEKVPPDQEVFCAGRRLCIRLNNRIWLLSGESGEELGSLGRPDRFKRSAVWGENSIVLGYPDRIEIVDIPDLKKKTTINLPGFAGAFTIYGDLLDYGLGVCDLGTGKVVRKLPVQMSNNYTRWAGIPFRNGTVFCSSRLGDYPKRAALFRSTVLSNDVVILYEELRE